MNDIKEKIKEIESRNKKVESDKAWETSWTRRSLLTAFTYLAIGVYMRAVNIPDPWLNAVVPAVAFMLSTLTMPFFKKLWLRNKNKTPRVDEQDISLYANAERGQEAK